MWNKMKIVIFSAATVASCVYAIEIYITEHSMWKMDVYAFIAGLCVLCLVETLKNKDQRKISKIDKSVL